MSRIHILSEQLSNRIAAGEVIERPASVVKELVENSIDAGAGHIRVEIERAGSRLIAVTDDGCGMDAEDVVLALAPHGTSKIASDEDITRILTLGFRGEAIPSIAAVSRFTLRSRRAEDAEGTRVTVEGGELTANEPCGLAPGTSIQVRDLFYNVPARRKFLKSAPTEEHHIVEMMTMLMLPYPAIHFELFIDGRPVLSSPGAATLEPRLRTLFGKSYAANLRELEHREEGVELRGYIAAPGFTRNSRREQRVFVNGRAVESPAIYRGLREGYATLAERGRYSPCLLFLTLAPEEVDVNVHPAKREVRFKREYVISRAVQNAVSRALRRPEPTPEATAPGEGGLPLTAILEQSSVSYRPADFEQPELTVLPPREQRAYPAPPAPELDELIDSPPPRNRETPPPVAPEPDSAAKSPPTSGPETPPAPAPELTARGELVFSGEWPREVLGILDATYILASSANGLVLIDQHAAHERVLFEELLAAARSEQPGQRLLLPQTVELPRPAAALLLRSREFFARLGFDLEPMGGTAVMVNAVPLNLPPGELTDLLLDTLTELVENQSEKLPLALEYVARAACRAAVKAHDLLDLESARHLLERLGRCRQGTLCPHGRPTMLTITYAEILRRFGRR